MVDIVRRDFSVTADDGVTLSVIEKSSGEADQPKILLVHGSGVGWEYWDVPLNNYSVMDNLAAAGFDVFALECRGYGRSDKPDGRTITSDRLAEDTALVAREISPAGERVGLVGHSSSGIVILMAAAKSSDLWSRMVIIGAPYQRLNPQFEAYAAQMIKAAEEEGEDTVPNGHHLEIEKRLNQPEQDIVKWYKGLVSAVYPRIPAAIFHDVIENPSKDLIPSVVIPTLLVNGSNDYVVDPGDALDLLNDLGAADKGEVILPGSFHLPFLEKKGHQDLISCLNFWFSRT
ncbi:MAG: alpha/beta hydrolase [Rhodospirillaceae bacterium]|jgi:pimeloyl-ACP methyl ester carboxylesterase|nr:alpha/beta hydrolase [Rhodospirillaceae bacterium]